MAVIEKKLHTVARLWNLHRIRPSCNNSSPSGRPYLLYHHPERKGTVDCLYTVDSAEQDIAREMCCGDIPLGFSPEFNELAELIISEEGLQMPENALEAKNLYLTLVNEIEKI